MLCNLCRYLRVFDIDEAVTKRIVVEEHGPFAGIWQMNFLWLSRQVLRQQVLQHQIVELEMIMEKVLMLTHLYHLWNLSVPQTMSYHQDTDRPCLKVQ